MAEDNGPVTDYFGSERADLLGAFAGSPTGFILGLILTPLLNGIENLTVKAISVVNLLFFGGARSSTSGNLGLVDIPVIISSLMIDAGSAIGEPVLDSLIGPGVELLIDFFDWTGPAGLLGAAIVLAIVMVVYATGLRTAVEIVLDIIPGGGAFIN